jgi:hypothetical protein
MFNRKLFWRESEPIEQYFVIRWRETHLPAGPRKESVSASIDLLVCSLCSEAICNSDDIAPNDRMTSELLRYMAGSSRVLIESTTLVFGWENWWTTKPPFFFFNLVCETIGTAASPGLLCQSRVIVKMTVEKQMECRLAGEPEVLGENLLQRHFCPSQNPTWPNPTKTLIQNSWYSGRDSNRARPRYKPEALSPKST